MAASAPCGRGAARSDYLWSPRPRELRGLADEIAHLRSRELTVSGARLSELPALQLELAEMWAAVEACRLQVFEAARRSDEGAVAHARGWDATAEVPVAAVVLTDGLSQPWPLARTLQNSILETIALAERQGSDLALLLVDVDHFKRVNDRFGHQEGDRVLKAVAAVLAAGVREQDIVARFGGDEFAVLLPNTGLDAAIMVAEHLRCACRDAVRLQPRLTLSSGIATFASGDSEVTLIGRADEALYASKAQGRNRVTAVPARLAGGPQPA